MNKLILIGQTTSGRDGTKEQYAVCRQGDDLNQVELDIVWDLIRITTGHYCGPDSPDSEELEKPSLEWWLTMKGDREGCVWSLNLQNRSIRIWNYEGDRGRELRFCEGQGFFADSFCDIVIESFDQISERTFLKFTGMPREQVIDEVIREEYRLTKEEYPYEKLLSATTFSATIEHPSIPDTWIEHTPITPYEPGGVARCLCLRKLPRNEGTPFVVHNAFDDRGQWSYAHGSYCRTIRRAVVSYEERKVKSNVR